MDRRFIIFSALFLVACGTSPVATKEYSCAPQNISFFLGSLRCEYAGPVSNRPEPLKIECKDGTYKEGEEGHSCLDQQGILHVVRPIKVSREELFAKKQECQKYVPQIEKRLAEEQREMSLPGSLHTNQLENVFYSVSMNSCLYVSIEREVYKDGPTFVTYVVSDALTGQRLMNTLDTATPENFGKQGEEFQRFLKVYE